MAHADKKHFGQGVQGKGDGTGAMTEADTAGIPANGVLSNRDKQGSESRGKDGGYVKTQQYQDHAGNRRTDDEDRR
ncbi:hypothetical protein [Cereibacter sphaeroides]|uniref:hypothetical protein n=1 Tax=Cereibacter sphaeroides TaxID=1063 RepID=UPI0000663FEE|nr:hypothetical protein Rsph17029_2597 [Cereibacter sphaeroides ATCC 17029]